ncbi:MAG: 3-methyl-2-oxobutanoate hydroxymethyltransferase [Pseudomonadota bacterium]
MSVSTRIKALTPPDILAMKGDRPIVSLTAYTTPVAKLIDPHTDLVLVGDSVGMVMHGMPNTLGVTVEMMILHGRAVRRGLKSALLVIDMPFGSYEKSPEQAFDTASLFMRETECGAVKIEGGIEMAETIEFLTQRGIPVMAHVGLTPQSVNVFGGYKTQGKGEDEKRIIKDALAIEKAGAFSVVCEKMPDALARKITKKLKIPTIGIGASMWCDGQILVIDDMLGMFTEFKPKFVKRYTDLGSKVQEMAKEYAEEVRNRTFPTPDHVYDYAGDE